MRDLVALGMLERQRHADVSIIWWFKPDGTAQESVESKESSSNQMQSTENGTVPNPIKNYVYRTLADISLATRELGYKPKWTLDSGIKHLVKLYAKSMMFAAHEA